MANAQYVTGADQFATQDIFRTISIKLQPYIPFTQAYRMGLVGGHFMHITERGTSGYFHWAPTEAEEEEETDLLGRYPWKTRRKAYNAQGAGRLLALNSINRQEMALKEAGNVIGDASTDIMGKDLAQALDTFSVETRWGGIDFSPRSSYVKQEIELEMISEALEVEAAEQGISFTDHSAMLPAGTRDPRVTNKAQFPLGGFFDVKLEHETSFTDFLQDALPSQDYSVSGQILESAVVNPISVDESVMSMEISQAAPGPAGYKPLTAHNWQNMAKGGNYGRPSHIREHLNLSYPETMKAQWTDHLAHHVERLNARMSAAYLQVARNLDQTATEADKLEAMLETEFFQTQGWLTEHGDQGRGLMVEVEGGISGGMLGTQYQADMAIRAEIEFNREMARRLLLDVQLGLISGVTEGAPARHLWSAPLVKGGGGYLGVTMFWPTVEELGQTYATFGGPQDVGGVVGGATGQLGAQHIVPQIGWDPRNVWLIQAFDGNIVHAYADHMKEVLKLSNEQLTVIHTVAKRNAANAAVAIWNRLFRMGDYIKSRVSMDAIDNIGLGVDVTQLTHLRSTAVAQELLAQIKDYYGSGQAKSEVRQWYDQLMSESNRLTKLWYEAMPQGPPAKSYPNTMGTTIGSEYVLGDTLGNPRKHYLGVWSGGVKKTWRGEAEGGKGDTGYNLSISPMITSRRAGVSQFR